MHRIIESIVARVMGRGRSNVNLARPCEHVTIGMRRQHGKRPAAECVDCVIVGSKWMHLRQCLTCGEVRCCDSSPMQHATKHFVTTGHAVSASAETNESWAWCYPHHRFLGGTL